MKSSPLKRGTKPLRRYTWLNKVSARRLRETPARRACVAAVIARDKVCQFWPYATRTPDLPYDFRTLPSCQGKLTAHEPAHRRNSDYTNPDDCIALCALHNNWLETEPEFGYATGLFVRGNGLRLRP